MNGRDDMITVKTLSHGMMGTNTYLVKDERGNAFVVDPAVFDRRLEEFLGTEKVKALDYILLTHGHFDHITGVSELKEKYGGKIVIHKDDEKAFWDKTVSLSAQFGTAQKYPERADITVEDGDTLSFSDKEIKVIHTPGHTVGGVCYIIENEMFSGDTLFKGSIGRSDFPGGNMLTLVRSVGKLKKLGVNYNVYPGHGDSTTMDYENKTNPFCKFAK